MIVLLFGTGVGLFLAPLNSKYRDISHFTPFALQCFYYASPIIYPLSKVPAWAKPWFVLNPLSTVITSFRMIFAGQTPNLGDLALTFFCALVTFFLGCWYFMKQEKNTVDLL